MKKYILRGLLCSIPGLCLSVFFDFFIKKNWDFLSFLNQYGTPSVLGRFFGGNPYIYHIVGIYLGFILSLLFQLTIKNGLKKWVWSVTFVACGVGILICQDLLLVITVFSFAPAMAIYEMNSPCQPKQP